MLKSQSFTIFLLLLIATLVEYYFTRPQNPRPEEVRPLDMFSGLVMAVVGFSAGLLGGIIGTGGCSLMLPVIHFWMSYPAPIAVGTTLFAVIFTAVSGGYGHLIRRNLDVRATLWLGGIGVLGVLLGSWIFLFLTAQTKLLGLILGIVFLWPALRMIKEGIFRGKIPTTSNSRIPGTRLGLSLFGFIVGVTTGVAGLGGGYALVPGLIYLFHAPVYVTMGTSLAVMIPLALVGGLIKLLQGFVDIGAGLLLALGTIIGAQVGAAIIKRFKPATLKLIFGVYFLYVSLKFITGYFGITIW